MLLGYNTNGMAHHDLLEAIDLLADIGYESIAITIDHTAFSPHARYNHQRTIRLLRLLQRRQLRTVIETGARFLLNPREKHEPTLVSRHAAERQRRIDFYKHAVDVAAELASDCVSLWSGRLPAGIDREEALGWLATGLRQVNEYAARQHVTIAFEPEPGMLIDTMAAWEELLTQEGMDDLCLTLDVGHLHCQGEGPIDDVICRWASRLVNVHVEDMRAGVHEHLMFGEGQIDFGCVFRGLSRAGYVGGAHVELSRHSHEAPTAAKKAFEFLQGVLQGI